MKKIVIEILILSYLLLASIIAYATYTLLSVILIRQTAITGILTHANETQVSAAIAADNNITEWFVILVTALFVVALALFIATVKYVKRN